MKREPKIAVATFLRGTVAAGCAAAVASLFSTDAEGLSQISFCFAQLSLAGCWLTLGKSHLARRLVVVLISVAMWSALIPIGHQLKMAVLLEAAAIGFCWRLAGWQIGMASRWPSPSASHQFSVRQLLALTTCVAVLLGGVRLLGGDDPVIANVVTLAMLCLGPAGVGMISVWASLSRWRWFVRWPIVAAAVPLFAQCVRLVQHDIYREAIFVLAFEALLVALFLWPYRRLGYRFVRKPLAVVERNESVVAADSTV